MVSQKFVLSVKGVARQKSLRSENKILKTQVQASRFPSKSPIPPSNPLDTSSQHLDDIKFVYNGDR